MKNLLFILLAIPLISYGQTQATLLYNWHDSTILSYNEVWGVVANDKEFVVMGSISGTHFFDLSDMSNPQELPNAYVIPGPGNVVSSTVKPYS